MRISDWSSDVCSSDLINGVDQRLAGFAHLNQGNTHQDRNQDDLKHDAIGECTHEGVRDDVEKEINGAALLTGSVTVLADSTCIERAGIETGRASGRARGGQNV